MLSKWIKNVNFTLIYKLQTKTKKKKNSHITRIHRKVVLKRKSKVSCVPSKKEGWVEKWERKPPKKRWILMTSNMKSGFKRGITFFSTQFNCAVCAHVDLLSILSPPLTIPHFFFLKRSFFIIRVGPSVWNK